MRKYLLFRLYGSLAGWGDIAGDEHRPTYAHPSKSAIVGLLSAALGLRRNQEEEQLSLQNAYGLAIRVDDDGTPLRDYHTTQVPPQKKSAFSRTRRDEVMGSVLGTILSQRDYRCDVLYTISLWRRDSNLLHSLEMLADALATPEFCLYLGRKCCPLALPVKAQIIEAATLKEAFEKASFPAFPRFEPKTARIYWEDPCESGFDPTHSFVRRDAVRSRARWQFSERWEWHVTLDSGTP